MPVIDTVSLSEIEESCRRDAQAGERVAVGRLLGLIATALFALFLVLVLVESLPVRLLDPAWQLRLSAALIRNGLMPVLGIVMVPLAAVIDPASTSLIRYRDWLRRWTILVALGYVLLIPLQGYAVWKSLGNLRGNQVRQFDQTSQTFSEFRKAIQSAHSTADLQRRFQALRGPSLPPLDLTQPLPALRKRLLDGLEGAETMLRDRLLASPSPDSVQALILQGLRIAFSSLILALAFAASAHRRHARVSILEEWRQGWSRRYRAGRIRSQSHRFGQ